MFWLFGHGEQPAEADGQKAARGAVSTSPEPLRRDGARVVEEGAHGDEVREAEIE